MSRALVLACGNSLRGDDGAGAQIAQALQIGLQDAGLEIHSQLQWTPELAEPISHAELVIFVDASACLSPGDIRVERITPQDASANTGNMTHQCNPSRLLELARLLYGKNPQRSFLVTIGGASFGYSSELSEPVRRAVPHAVNRIRAFLSGVSFPCADSAARVAGS
jgi:hydrogenase maturation protease